jgi:hypothetical protein
MSTRCQVIVKDSYEEVWLYHHWDGYPSSMGPLLVDFVSHIRRGDYRDNVEQSVGWLIVNNRPIEGHDQWKASDFEPCSPRMHGDIEWLYRVDVEALTIEMCAIEYDNKSFRPKLLQQQVFVPLDISVD